MKAMILGLTPGYTSLISVITKQLELLLQSTTSQCRRCCGNDSGADRKEDTFLTASFVNLPTPKPTLRTQQSSYRMIHDE